MEQDQRRRYDIGWSNRAAQTQEWASRHSAAAAGNTKRLKLGLKNELNKLGIRPCLFGFSEIVFVDRVCVVQYRDLTCKVLGDLAMLSNLLLYCLFNFQAISDSAHDQSLSHCLNRIFGSLRLISGLGLLHNTWSSFPTYVNIKGFFKKSPSTL